MLLISDDGGDVGNADGGDDDNGDDIDIGDNATQYLSIGFVDVYICYNDVIAPPPIVRTNRPVTRPEIVRCTVWNPIPVDMKTKIDT